MPISNPNNIVFSNKCNKEYREIYMEGYNNGKEKTRSEYEKTIDEIQLKYENKIIELNMEKKEN